MTVFHKPHTAIAGWWNQRWLLVAAVLLMAVPLLYPTVPPLVDLPGHMGRYEVQLSLDSSPFLKNFYQFKWALIGNLGLDLLVMPLAPLIGLESAVKLIVTLTPMLAAAGMLWIAHEVHGRVPPTAYLALPLAYSHPFHFGFVNFSLSMALALVSFALWLRLAKSGRWRLRALIFVPLGLILWLCHVFGWAVLGVMAFSSEVVREHDKRGGWIAPLFYAGINCLPLAPPALLVLAWRSGETAGQTGDWFNWEAKLLWAQMIMRDRWLEFDLGCVLFLTIMATRPLQGRFNRDLGMSRHLGATALFLLITYLCLPRVLLGSAYADMRLAPYVLAIALIGLRPREGISLKSLTVLGVVALGFLVVRTGGTTASFALYHQRHSAALEALNHVPRGARLASFVNRGCELPWYTNRMEHLPGLAIVRRHAFSNDQWVMPGAQLLTIAKKDAPGFVNDPSQLASELQCPTEVFKPARTLLARLPRSAFDYVWLIEPPIRPADIPSDFAQVWSNGRDSLYRIERNAVSGEKQP